MHFAIGAMAHTLTSSDTLEVISGGLCRSSDAETAIPELIDFLSAGFRASRSCSQETQAFGETLMKRAVRLILLLGIIGGIVYYSRQKPPSVLTLTGIVTTNDVIVSSQIAGRIDQLLVNEGDAVKRDQMLAVMQPDELMADRSYYEHSVEGLSSQVRESEAALRYQERQTVDQITQAEATLAATVAQQARLPRTWKMRR